MKSERAPDAKIADLKAARDASRDGNLARAREAENLPETDEHGIKFLQHQAPKKPVLCGVTRGLMRYPLWANGLVKEADGTVRPKIVMVPVSEQHSGGRLVEIYKQRKGFKEVSEIPDKYAEFRDPYLEAIAAWKEKMRKRAELQKQLQEAGFAPRKGGVTGVGTLQGLTGGR